MHINESSFRPLAVGHAPPFSVLENDERREQGGMMGRPAKRVAWHWQPLAGGREFPMGDMVSSGELGASRKVNTLHGL